HETVEDLLQQDVEVEQVAHSPRSQRRCRQRGPRAERHRIFTRPPRGSHGGCYRSVLLRARAGGIGGRGGSAGKKNAPDEPGQTSQGGNYDGWKRRLKIGRASCRERV